LGHSDCGIMLRVSSHFVPAEDRYHAGTGIEHSLRDEIKAFSQEGAKL